MNELQMIMNTENGLVTSTRIVAEYFGMEHKNVLKALDAKMGVATNGATLQTMFFESTYIHLQNKQEYREVLMNRDGFSLLAMGFTGAKALEFQLKFINEFNRMERELQATRTPQTYIEALQALLESETQKEVLKNTVIQQTPKVEYHDAVLSSTDSVSITTIAKEYGLSGATLNRLLNDWGIQFKVGKTWVLYSDHANEGYTTSSTTHYEKVDGSKGSKTHTQWTQKGRKFLHELLTKQGYSRFV